MIIGQSDDNPSCGNYLDSKYTLNHDQIMDKGIYYVAIQGIRNKPGIFDISMQCNTIPPTPQPSTLPTFPPSNSPTSTPTVPHKIAKGVITSLLFGTMGTALFVIGCYYLHKWRKFRKEKTTLENRKRRKNRSKNKLSTDSFTCIPNDDDEANDDDEVNLYEDEHDNQRSCPHLDDKKKNKRQKKKKSISKTTPKSKAARQTQTGSSSMQNENQLKPLSKRQRSQRRQLKKNTGMKSLRGLAGLQTIAEDLNVTANFGVDMDKMEVKSENSNHLEQFDFGAIMKIDQEARGDTVRGVTIRRIDGDATLASQLDGDEDVISLVLAHAIQCCEDQNGLDIFQVSVLCDKHVFATPFCNKYGT